MEANDLWDAVDPADPKEPIDAKLNKVARAAILSAIPEDVLFLVAKKKNAREVWTALKTMFLGVERVQEARVQSLQEEFDRLKMKGTETIDDYALKVGTIVNKIRELGENMEESYVVKRMLRSLPNKFMQIVSSIEQFADLKSMTVEELIGRLKAHEERLRNANLVDDEHVLLTRAQWKAKEEKGGEASGSGTNKGGRGRGRSRGRGRGDGERGNDKEFKFDKTKLCCYNCQNYGHYAPECCSKKEEMAHLVEKNDDEPAVLLVQMSEPAQLTNLPAEMALLNEEKVIPRVGDEENCKKLSWYLDTGASNHMSGCRDVFTELDMTVSGTVKFGDGSVAEIRGRGTVMFQSQTEEHKVLTNVYYIPQLRSNIISLGQLDENGCKSILEDGTLYIYDQERHLLAKVRRSSNRLYVLNLQPAQPVCLMSVHKEKEWLWHARFGRMNFRALRDMSKQQLVEGLPLIEHVEQLCEGCLVGKQHRLPFPSATTYRAQSPLELLHGDLCGPISPATPSGKRYFLLIVDDCTRFMWIVLIKSKDEALAAFKSVRAKVELETGLKVKALRTDRGGEFTSNDFHAFCDSLGMKRFLTAPYTPQQNGVAERRNQTVVGMTRCLLKSKKMPGKFWG